MTTSTATTHTFYIGLDDLLPVVQEYLKNDDGSPIDMTNATSVLFYLWRFDSGARIDVVNGVAGTFLDKPNGKVQYAWALGDTATTGEHQRRWKVIFPGPKPISCPNDRTKGYPVFVS